MTTITLKINERSKAGKTLLSLLDFFTSENNGVEIVANPNDDKKKVSDVSENIPNTETIEAINDAKKGKVYRSKDLKDLMQHLNS
jgi:hypothetical protein